VTDLDALAAEMERRATALDKSSATWDGNEPGVWREAAEMVRVAARPRCPRCAKPVTEIERVVGQPTRYGPCGHTDLLARLDTKTDRRGLRELLRADVDRFMAVATSDIRTAGCGSCLQGLHEECSTPGLCRCHNQRTPPRTWSMPTIPEDVRAVHDEEGEVHRRVEATYPDTWEDSHGNWRRERSLLLDRGALTEVLEDNRG
jgi:hypothetical protein